MAFFKKKKEEELELPPMPESELPELPPLPGEEELIVPEAMPKAPKMRAPEPQPLPEMPEKPKLFPSMPAALAAPTPMPA